MFLLLVGVALCASLVQSLAASETPKNLVFILLDDLGWSDLGFKGAEFKTPFLDSLAAPGGGAIELTAHYAHPICAPSRAALLTGQWPWRVGLDNVWAQLANRHMWESAPTLAGILQNAGWRAALAGKWHLGHGRRAQLPTQRGFAEFHGNLNGWAHQTRHAHCAPVAGLTRDAAIRARLGDGDALCFHDVFAAAGNASLEAVDGDFYYEQSLLEFGRAFLARSAADKKPFFLFYAMQTPHSPIVAPPAPALSAARWAECAHIAHAMRRAYCAQIQFADAAIAALARDLKSLDLWRDSVVVVANDNGGQRGDERRPGALWSGWARNLPLRGGKSSAFEGGVRTVALLAGGVVDAKLAAAGAVAEKYDKLFWIGDWLPTLLALLGRPELTPQSGIDGASHAANLFRAPVARRAVRVEVADIRNALESASWLRHRDWKLVVRPTKRDPRASEDAPGAYPDWDGAPWRRPPFLRFSPVADLMLFDLARDPLETTDLAPRFPHIAASMRARLADLLADAVERDRYGQWPSPLVADPRNLQKCVRDGMFGVYEHEIVDDGVTTDDILRRLFD